MNKSPKMINGSKLNIRNDLLMKKLKVFYNKKEHIDELLPIINGNTGLSLRIIDWFVTNYCKKHNITYYINNNNGDINIDTYDGEQFIVWLRYKMQLKSFLKKQFDPFCRRERIRFFYQNDENPDHVITTIGQLNFFKWAIEQGVIEYIKQNLKEIETDMNENIRKNYVKKSKKNDVRKKRKELSSCAMKTMNKHSHKFSLNFD
jgi:hypothetical protein